MKLDTFINDLPLDVWLADLRQTNMQDPVLVRRATMLRLLWQESYLTRQGLKARVEHLLGWDCFGPAAHATFRQDVAWLRQVLAEAGYRLAYSRRPDWPGYYIVGRPRLDERLQRLSAGSVAEVDPQQMAVSRRLTPAQRFQQGHSMIRLAERVTAYRRYRRQTELNTGQTYHVVREREVIDMAETSMDFADFMRLVLDAVKAAEVEYLIGGAIAVWAWGEARTTRDFDLVINLPFERIVSLSQELEQRDMLVPAEVILDLLTKAEGDLPINAIHLYTGYKAELFLLRHGDTYRAMALARRRLVDLGPPLGEVYVHAPEDLILNKLRYYSLSQQPKHTRDIAGMLLALGDELDTSYLETWAARLGLTAVWRDVRDQALKR